MSRTSLAAAVSAFALFASLAAAFSTETVHAQRPSPPQASESKIWEGIYSARQAKRGEGTYAAYCARCHGVDMVGRGRGGGGGPALKGDPFWMDWEAASVSRLATTVQTTMPRDAPASLEDDQYADLVAFILQANAFPPGAADLVLAGDRLEAIKIAKKDGVREVTNFSLVRIVGCLTHGSGPGWVLTNMSDPIVTKDEAANAAALQEAESSPLGQQTIRLIGATPFTPEAHNGHKMEAHGLLNRAPDDSRLDLTSLQMVGAGAGCPN